MTTGTRKNHDFCWINVMTPELDRAAAFFGKLFGWTYAEGVPGGRLILVDGKSAGALMDVAKMPGTPPSIGVMVRVEDTDATVARIRALGGKADDAFDVLTNGRMALCTDPTGAFFGLWQPKSKGTIECDSRAHGAPTWFEAITTDVDRAVAFYTALFGWKDEPQKVPGMTYHLLSLDGAPVAGAMAYDPKMTPLEIRWATSFATKNVDETVRLAVELGGKSLMTVQKLAGVGRFGLLESPQGVTFHLIEWES